jgi:3-oxoacyl-[acyl-carrier-protein] synthase-3
VSGGIVDFAIAFPKGRVTVDELHERSGVAIPEILEITHCREFPVLGPDERMWEVVVDAAWAVLDRGGTEPDRITKVIYVGSGCWDAPMWSPAAKVADELGITQAHCFEVTNFCNALPVGIGIAVGGIALGADEHGGSFGYLGLSARTDPAWCDLFSGEYHDAGVHLRRRGSRRALADAYTENYLALVERRLAELARPLSDVRYLLVNQNDRNIQDRLLAALGLPAERSVFNHSSMGHMGCTDTMIALRQVWDRGALDDGDLVLLAASGLGFSWSVTALEYRAD